MAETRSAGWYPDPDGGAGERWWNGAGWSDSRRGGAGTAASPYAPAIPPVIYSADNPAPQGPGELPAATRTGISINTRVNRNAMIGFVTGLISLFFNVFYLLAPLAIVFSVLGIVRARQLRAQGTTANLMAFALIGLGLGIVSAIIGLVSIIGFITAVTAGTSS
jgi:hypothetical protein